MEHDNPRPAPSGFARLAVRISAWTSRALLSGVILVAALAVGRQTVEWWHGTPPPIAAVRPDAALAAGLGDEERPHVLQLGDQPWAMLRQSFAGTREQADRALGERCRERIEAAHAPPDPPGRMETEFLATLKGTPVAESAGRWALHRIPAGFPVLVGVRPTTASRSDDQAVAANASRVVIWALAAPVATNRWSLYVFYPEKGADSKSPSIARVPVPPGTAETLGLRVLGGGAVMGFQGPDTIPAFMLFYDQWFSRLGWSSSGWQTAGQTWHVVYRSKASDGRMADIRIGLEGSGRATGLVVVSGEETR
jgi:hypothetical protein